LPVLEYTSSPAVTSALGLDSGNVTTPTLVATCPSGYVPIAANYTITNPYAVSVEAVTINTVNRTYAMSVTRYISTSGDPSLVTMTAVCVRTTPYVPPS